MTTRRFIRALIVKRIESLFGSFGYKKGQYYFDDCYFAVVQVVNDSGGTRRILEASSPSKLLDILDGIETYLYYKKNEREIK